MIHRFRPSFSHNSIVLGCGVSAVAILLLFGGVGQRRRNYHRGQAAALCEQAPSRKTRQLRSHQTWADEYFRLNGRIPEPPQRHVVLDPGSKDEDKSAAVLERKNILVIGDVHGCYQELLDLHQRAVNERNDQMEFRHVILVGDLCNKGPHSAKVIRYVRDKGWLAVRGNHDDAALSAALGHGERRRKKKYEWIFGNNNNNNQNGKENVRPREDEGVKADEETETAGGLSDDDILWLSQLPYTIRIPWSVLSMDLDDASIVDHDALIVHAGLIPGVPLNEQTVETMVTIREVSQPRKDKEGYSYFDRKSNKSGKESSPVAWASVYQGPSFVVFGHDARRGLQQHPWATGLDSGACYGKSLTGIVLPSRTLVSVIARDTYCPIVKGTKN